MKEKSYTVTDLVKLHKPQTPKTTVWSREKISHLIELYKKHECLWNHWHEAYKSKDKRKRAIEEICQTLNIENFEFGKKIHNLRNQFNTEMKKLEQRIEESGVNINENNVTEVRCKWSHFESLMFLRNVIEPRPVGYQSTLQPAKKMCLKFGISSSEDEINGSTVLPNIRNSTANAEDLSQFQCEENNINEEVITDDFQSFESEILEIEQASSSGEICDQKYQPPQAQDISANSSTKSKNSKLHHTTPPPPQTSTVCSYGSQADINVNDDCSTIDYNANKATTVPSHSQILTASSAVITTPPVISAIATSNSSNRPASILRDQWDAFGELVANEFRNLNSEISQKRLKRKIMQAMLEVGEEDDELSSKHSRSSLT